MTIQHCVAILALAIVALCAPMLRSSPRHIVPFVLATLVLILLFVPRPR